MKKTVLTLALSLISFATFAAEVAGGSSTPNLVQSGKSNLFGSERAGLFFNNNSSTVIDLAGGPVAQSNSSVGRPADANGKNYIKGKDVNILAGILLGDTKIGQTWKNDVAYNGQTTSINSVRQMIVPPLPIIPNFGGLVIGKVQGSAVYFGEWSPKGANFADVVSTDLNMSSASRTVWFSGENPTKTMPTLVNAQYNVVGINQHNPESPNVYTGVLTATYGGGSGKLEGALTRSGSATLDFNGTAINSNGSFAKSDQISGQFYNNAKALAGIHTAGAGVQDDVAFGGARK
jgi:hypothetical protein